MIHYITEMIYSAISDCGIAADKKVCPFRLSDDELKCIIMLLPYVKNMKSMQNLIKLSMDKDKDILTELFTTMTEDEVEEYINKKSKI